MNINFKEIEKRNRKYAEIQTTNEENEQKLSNLEDEKNILLHELESQKITLLKLKNNLASNLFFVIGIIFLKYFFLFSLFVI